MKMWSRTRNTTKARREEYETCGFMVKGDDTEMPIPCPGSEKHECWTYHSKKSQSPHNIRQGKECPGGCGGKGKIPQPEVWMVSIRTDNEVKNMGQDSTKISEVF